MILLFQKRILNGAESFRLTANHIVPAIKNGTQTTDLLRRSIEKIPNFNERCPLSSQILNEVLGNEHYKLLPFEASSLLNYIILSRFFEDNITENKSLIYSGSYDFRVFCECILPSIGFDLRSFSNYMLEEAFLNLGFSSKDAIENDRVLKMAYKTFGGNSK